MKVLITGCEGQVGQALRLTMPSDCTGLWYAREDFDLGNSQRMPAALQREKPDLVINAAAYTKVDHAESDSDQAMAINGVAVAELAKLCAQFGAKLVQFSTDFVFDGTQSHPYAANAATNPSNVYGESKLAGERAALAFPGNLVIRTAWVYAAHGRNFVKTMLELMVSRDELAVVSDQVGTPTHALSLAAATWRLIEANASGLHQFTDAGVASWYDFAVAIQEEAAAFGKTRRA
jgi:dTDP-4-dehydrorhamnose reductase